MELIKISHLSKSYKIDKKDTIILDDINLILPNTGLVVILGKSGSGKSTLLNLIGGIDKASKGKILFFGEHKIKSPHISFVFQHYHLLENETPLFNVMLPALIQGFDKKIAEEQARELLNLYKLDESIINKETRLLSGGEKERIAVLRALITDPSLILADEPTGALDSQNAIKTMDILKKASKKRLVLLVTHNNRLAKEYADRIITLSNGKIIDDKTINECNEEVFKTSIKKKKKNRWRTTLINHNFKKRIRRNIVSIIGMAISLTFCYLLFGFSFQSENAINAASQRHFDFGSSIIQKEIVTPSSSTISLVRTLRPDYDEAISLEEAFPEFIVMPNYDAVFNTGQYTIGNKDTNELHSSFIYDFASNCFDKSLVLSGNTDNAIYWFDVIANKSAMNLIDDSELHLKIAYEYSVEIEEQIVVDYFEVEQKLHIVAIADEFDFLSVPKIYFNYQKIDELFERTILENLSFVREEQISWKDLVVEALPGDDLSAFSMRCFLKDIQDKQKVVELKNSLTEEIKVENDSLTIKEALESLTLAATYGLDIFLVIALVGSALILGIFSYSAYVDDKKESSILSCLGASNREIISIFVAEAMIVAFFGFLFSTVIAYLLENPVNYLLTNILDISNLIKIPFSNMFGIKGFLPLTVLFCSCLITLIFSSVPILINKSVSIKKELSDL